MTAFAFVFPGQGSQSVGMLDAWGAHPAVAATLAEASAALGEDDIAALIQAGPKEQLDLTTVPACDAGRRRRLLPRLDGLGLRAGFRCRPFARRIQRARRGGRADARRRAAAGAVSRPGDAGGGAGRHRGDGRDSRSGLAGGAGRLRRGGGGERRSRRSRRRSTTQADRHRRQGRGRAGLRGAQGQGGQARPVAARLGTVPLEA